jgi:hypothetical protein
MAKWIYQNQFVTFFANVRSCNMLQSISPIGYPIIHPIIDPFPYPLPSIHSFIALHRLFIASSSPLHRLFLASCLPPLSVYLCVRFTHPRK